MKNNTILKIIVPILLVVVWFGVTENRIVSPLVLPSIKSVGEAFFEQIKNGRLIEDLWISFLRIIKGYVLATIFGGALGVAMGIDNKWNQLFLGTLTAVRQVPIMAWVPLLVIWFGIGEGSKVAVIFLGAYFPILVNTMSGISRTDPKLIEVGKMYHLSKWQMFVKIYFPSALPSMFVGLKLGLSISWMAVVGAEMIAARSGIGFRMNDARSLMQYPVVFCGIFSIAFLGACMDWMLSKLAKICTPWEQKVGKNG